MHEGVLRTEPNEAPRLQKKCRVTPNKMVNKEAKFFKKHGNARIFGLGNVS
jgi:hypothetical protein